MSNSGVISYIQNILTGKDGKSGLMLQLNTPGSSLFLPTVIQDHGYDPEGPVGDWNLGTLSGGGGHNAAQKICKGVGAARQPPENWTSDGDPSVDLNQVLLVGLSNVKVDSMVASDPPAGTSNIATITAKVQFSVYPANEPDAPKPLATQISFTGNFSLTQGCVADGTTTPIHNEEGSGTFTVVIGTGNGASANGTLIFYITKLAPCEIEMEIPPPSGSFQAINFAPIDLKDMVITPKITSFPKGTNAQSYDNLAFEVLNAKRGQNSVLEQMNSTINSGQYLDGFAKVLNQQIQTYLKNNKQYPYDHPCNPLY